MWRVVLETTIVKQTNMHSQKLNRPGLDKPLPLHLQIPLEHPDHRRRPKIKPRPVRAAIYFGGKSVSPAIIRGEKTD